jgi:hypothetical protein
MEEAADKGLVVGLGFDAARGYASADQTSPARNWIGSALFFLPVVVLLARWVFVCLRGLAVM